MKRSVDVVIIGAGIIGLSTALQLARRSSMSIAVLDRGSALGSGSSGASSAVCRHLYTHDEMVRLARDGIGVYRDWAEFVDGCDRPSASLNQIGVLWMGNATQNWCEGDARRLTDLGVRTELLTDQDLLERFPAINPCGLAPDFATGLAHPCKGAGTHLLEVEAGYMDPQYALEDLAVALSARGVRVERGVEVTQVRVDAGVATGVECANGDRYHCKYVVNASGPWCNRLLANAGLAPRWPLVPTRIQILHVELPEESALDIPVVGDLSGGIYFRPQGRGGRQLIVGSTLAEDEEESVGNPDEFDRLADEHFRVMKLHALQHRIPSLPDRARVGGYSGLYTVNREDMHPVVGRTAIEGFFAANGFSGHGFKLGPAIGSLLAQEISGVSTETDTRVPIEFLSWDREPIALDSKTVLA